MDAFEFGIAALALAAGGILKGGIGAGAPLLAVPLLAILYNVPVAVAIFAMPNLFSNAWQAWQYRAHIVSHKMGWRLSLGGALGALVGSVLLAKLPSDALLAGLGGVVFLYIAMRLARPDWGLSRAQGERYSALAGVSAGIMQGAGGISAPVSITFLHAMRLERLEFIATISVFFAAMALTQIPALVWFDILTVKLTLWSCLAAVPLFGAMPLGAWLGNRINRAVFDKVILWLLAAIAVKLFYDAIF